MKHLFVLTLILGACTSNQAPITVACTIDDLAPSLTVAGSTVTGIVDPAAASDLAKANAAEAAVHPLVQAACAAALTDSKPVVGSVVVVPVTP